MMTQRNVEIQLQALDLIEHRQTGIVNDENDSTKEVRSEADSVNSSAEKVVAYPLVFLIVIL